MVKKNAIQPEPEELGKDEIKVVAMTRLMLNYGRLVVNAGEVVILGPKDREQGVHIENLLKSIAVVPYESQEQAEAIRKEWDEVRGPDRKKLRFGPRR